MQTLRPHTHRTVHRARTLRHDRRRGSSHLFDTLECRAMLAAGAIQFSTAAYSVVDSAGTVPIVMTRTSGSDGPVSVTLDTSDGTAVAGTNYDALSGSVSFPDGVTTEQVNLTVLPDPVANLPGWTVNLALSNPTGGAALGSPASAVLTITHVATPGDHDGSFGTNGRVILLPGPPNLNVWASPASPLLIASDGSSYGVSVFDMTTPYIEVNKFTSDGTPDTSYGTDGLASVAAPGDSVAGCAFQPDGKILVDGTDDTSSGDFLVVVRFDTDGTPDSTFGQGGVATLAIPTQFDGVTGGITVLSGGQIVVSGLANPGLALVAFGPDGSPSLTFGAGGFASTTLGPDSASRPSVLAMPDGTCVVSGYVGSGGAQQMTLWRFNADGSLDTAFGSGGIALGPAGYFGGQAMLAPNGDIVQLGTGGGGANGAGGGTIAFYRNNGTLDASFGSAGETDFATIEPSALAFQPSGQIIVIGVIWTGYLPGPSVLTRLNANGSLDTGFGQDGYAYDGGSESPNAIASLPDDTVLEGATTTDTQDGISGILFELDRYIAPTSILTPTITWTNPSDIVYGTALGATQLDATASVQGTFGYSPAAGTVLDASDNQMLSVTFTPTDTTDYNTASDSVPIDVDAATPIITWATPTDIIYGTALSSTQLDATSTWTVAGVNGTVAGTFTYSPSAGTVLTGGKGETLSVTFTPTDGTDYTTATKTVKINVTQATPTLTWVDPPDITFGTPLGPIQLDATASVPGTFVYTPAANTILNSGPGQALSATFTPTDATDYRTVTTPTTINVLPAPQKATPIITWPDPAEIAYGTLLGAAQLDATATFDGTAVAGAFAYSPGSGTVLSAAPGQTLSVSFTPDDTTDYKSISATTMINVAQATPTITWADPAGIVYGAALGATQLDATASVPGTFAYTPAMRTVPTAGNNQTLSVSFTPDNTTNYKSTSATTMINVAQAPPTIAWANPGDILLGTSLGAAQLDATASVPGVFTYTPPAGTILNAGADQTLAVTFTPTDTTDYSSATAYSHINVALPPLVMVTSVHLETVHLTKRKTATEIVIAFSGGLDSADADNLENYQLAAPGKGKKSKTYSKHISLKSAMYSLVSGKLTLQVSGKLALSPAPLLRITAAGILDSTGRPLDGNGDGQPGGDYVALLTRGGAEPQIIGGAETFVRLPSRFPTRR
jgi:uncharacterized delta-60 repeat protein